MAIVMVLLILVTLAVYGCERTSKKLMARQAAEGDLPSHYSPLVRALNVYLRARRHVLDHWLIYGTLVFFGIPGAILGAKRAAAGISRWRETTAGMAFEQRSYALPRVEFSLRDAMLDNPDPVHQVVLGVDPEGAVVHLTDESRESHVHLLGQTGSGKTRSVIEPLLLQDLWRGRSVLVLDGKGSQENEDNLAAIAAQVGRLDHLKIFTLNPGRTSHTYNPLHTAQPADRLAVRAIAERVFASFAGDMDSPYYRDQSRQLFAELVCGLAGTGAPICLLDVTAAIQDEKLRRWALKHSEDREARRKVHGQFAQLGKRANETFTGLLAAIERYSHPALNSYDPDIILEDDLAAGRPVAFFLPANYYQQLARHIGMCVLQHVQQIGALRQLDRSRSQEPVYVYADEFYSFAYEGVTNAVNKLRDARISLLLSHQSLSDLSKVSAEFADGIWDNTRNKIVLFQNDAQVCERIANGLGTVKGTELTVRRTVDAWLNSVSALEASSREVDSYRLHPNQIKALERGQAYLAQDSRFVGVNLAMLPRLPHAVPPPPKRPTVRGIGLYRMFVEDVDPDKVTWPWRGAS